MQIFSGLSTFRPGSGIHFFLDLSQKSGPKIRFFSKNPKKFYLKTYRNLLESIRNSAILWISHHSLEYSAKFREILIKIDAKLDEKRRKIANFCRILSKNPKKFHEIWLKF